MQEIRPLFGLKGKLKKVKNENKSAAYVNLNPFSLHRQVC
jgi:hypothetical protein